MERINPAIRYWANRLPPIELALNSTEFISQASPLQLADIASAMGIVYGWNDSLLLYSYWRRFLRSKFMIISVNPTLKKSDQESKRPWENDENYCASYNDFPKSKKIMNRLSLIESRTAIEVRKTPITVMCPWRTKQAQDLTTLKLQLGMAFLLRLIELCNPHVLIVHGNSKPPNPYAYLKAHYSHLEGASIREAIPHLKYPPENSVGAKFTIRRTLITLPSRNQRVLIGLPHLSWPCWNDEFLVEGLVNTLAMDWSKVP
jgi:hypothetical protein